MNIRDIVDVKKIVEIMEAWSTACNMATICMDADGEYITGQIGFTEFCTKYTRMSKEGNLRCKYCDRHNEGVYYCHTGLMDFGFDIVLDNGEVVGRIVGGQALSKPIDEEKIMALADELHLPRQEYLEAAQKIPIRDEKSIQASAFLLENMINYLVNAEYVKLLQKKYIAELEEVSNAKLENQAKSRFLSHMSHDMRTPLNGIIGLTNIMKSQLKQDEKVSDYVSKVSLLSEQLLSLMNDVLDMSQIESGKTELVHEVFDIYEVLGAMSTGLTVVAEANGVRLTGAHFDIVHSFLIGSPIHLQRILMNIISNSLKYNKPNGSSECWLTETPIDNNHSMYEFVVQDTGIGMSKEFLNRIFEPFEVENVHLAHTSTGLGMSITQKYVQLMGGTIQIDSEKNVGTTVKVSIPFEFVEETPKQNEVDSSEGLQGLRILVVEDNEINLKIVKYMLEDANATVSAAQNGKQALEMVQASKPDSFDVILMDIMMPIMNGLEATQAIRLLPREDTARIPIIAMTANTFQEDVWACLDAGMNDHIAKPLDVDIVIQKILEHCSKN